MLILQVAHTYYNTGLNTYYLKIKIHIRKLSGLYVVFSAKIIDKNNELPLSLYNVLYYDFF